MASAWLGCPVKPAIDRIFADTYFPGDAQHLAAIIFDQETEQGRERSWSTALERSRRIIQASGFCHRFRRQPLRPIIGPTSLLCNPWLWLFCHGHFLFTCWQLTRPADIVSVFLYVHACFPFHRQ